MDRLEEYVAKREQIENELLKLCAETRIGFKEILEQMFQYKKDFEQIHPRMCDFKWYFERLDYQRERALQYIKEESPKREEPRYTHLIPKEKNEN